jgi:hypothetical protein
MRRATGGLLLAGLVGWAAGCGPRAGTAPTSPDPSTAAAPEGKAEKGRGGGAGQPPPPPPRPDPPPGSIPEYHQLDPANHTIPARPVFARFGGRQYGPEAMIRENKLVFRQGKTTTDLEVEIELPKGREMPDGLRLVVHPEQQGDVPQLTVKTRGRGKGEPEAKQIEKYALTLELGARNKDGLPGKVYLCLPDPEKSYLIGWFEAELK